jgi:LysM repeat protein
MRRLWVLTVVSLVVTGSAAALAGCGSASGSALDTLPPIKTTTSTTTTTTTPYTGRIFYVVKRGDNLSEIAKAYKVTSNSIMELNGLTSDVLQVGQELEIPNDVRLDAELPSVSTAPSSTDP